VIVRVQSSKRWFEFFFRCEGSTYTCTTVKLETLRPSRRGAKDFGAMSAHRHPHFTIPTKRLTSSPISQAGYWPPEPFANSYDHRILVDMLPAGARGRVLRASSRAVSGIYGISHLSLSVYGTYQPIALVARRLREGGCLAYTTVIRNMASSLVAAGASAHFDAVCIPTCKRLSPGQCQPPRYGVHVLVGRAIRQSRPIGYGGGCAQRLRNV
jgi:hypothetical protein